MPAKGAVHAPIVSTTGPNSLERWFTRTAEEERLWVPASLVDGQQTGRDYSGYVLMDVAATGTTAGAPRGLDPFYWMIDPGYGIGGVTSRGLVMGLAGSARERRGADSIARWTVFVPGEGWKDPTADDAESACPRPRLDHHYRFVVFLGKAPVRPTLGSGFAGDGRFDIALAPLSLRPGVQVPEIARNWVPLTPDILTLREHRVSPATVEDIGKRPRSAAPLPVPRPTGAGPEAGYEVVVPGSDMLPVRWLPEWGNTSRDHLKLPSGRDARLGMAGRAPTLLVTGKPKPLTFGSFVGDPRGWPGLTRQALEGMKARYGLDSYQIFGLARSGTSAYIGVVWCDPNASAHYREAGLVLKLGAVGNAAPVRMLPGERDERSDLSPGPPVMDTLPDGRLVLVHQSRMWLSTSRGGWREIRMALPADGDVWLRGQWLILQQEHTYRASIGYPVDIQRTEIVTEVQDVLTRRVVRRMRWATLDYRENNRYDAEP